MTGLLPCTFSGSCQADSSCHRPPRFQIHLDAAQPSPRPPVRRRIEACASHLGTMVAAMTTWAREHDLTGADLTILTIELPAASHPGQQPPTGGGQTSGLVFSTIHLSA